MALQIKNTSIDLFISVNLDYFAKNPDLLGEHCYELRKSLSENPNILVPKSFFANLLNCKVIQLARIESGYVTDFALAIRYFKKICQVKQLFDD